MKTVHKFINRQITATLKSVAKQFPVIFLTGPRQSGKTTLLKKIFSKYNYQSLEDPDSRLWALTEPRDFLDHNAVPLIIDEAQYAPVLFSYIQLIVDEKQKPGMFILSGSQNFLMMSKITQSLAGRVAVISLLPLSDKELRDAEKIKSTEKLILTGFYPHLYDKVSDFHIFFRSYINTYVERDIRTMANIADINDFIRFMRICAGRAGQIINVSSLATDSGIAINTCKAWLTYLSASYIIMLVQPYYKNFSKRIIKSPKLYFVDTGLLCYLLGISSTEQLAINPLRGSLFENLFFSELLKKLSNSGRESNIWFWRDNHGTEIDFIIEEGPGMKCFEVKASKMFHNEHLSGLKTFDRYSRELSDRYLIYDGTTEREIEGIKLINWRSYFK